MPYKPCLLIACLFFQSQSFTLLYTEELGQCDVILVTANNVVGEMCENSLRSASIAYKGQSRASGKREETTSGKSYSSGDTVVGMNGMKCKYSGGIAQSEVTYQHDPIFDGIASDLDKLLLKVSPDCYMAMSNISDSCRRGSSVFGGVSMNFGHGLKRHLDHRNLDNSCSVTLVSTLPQSCPQDHVLTDYAVHGCATPGVFLSLPNGSATFENTAALRHAVTPTPDDVDLDESRLSVVFFQHQNLHYRDHGRVQGDFF